MPSSLIIFFATIFIAQIKPVNLCLNKSNCTLLDELDQTFLDLKILFFENNHLIA